MATPTNSQQRRWDHYIDIENRGLRDAKVSSLIAFVDELLRSPETIWKAWALDLAGRIVDEQIDLIVRQPLFERVLFPALLDALDAGMPGSARWLAGLFPLVMRCPDCMQHVGDDRCSEQALLRIAVQQDPVDRRSRQKLLQVMLTYLQYTLHELPSGVLRGVDGATVAECDELLAELKDFIQLANSEGWLEDYAGLVAKCDYHFRMYRQYLLQYPSIRGYAAFLETQIGMASP